MRSFDLLASGQTPLKMIHTMSGKASSLGRRATQHSDSISRRRRPQSGVTLPGGSHLFLDNITAVGGDTCEYRATDIMLWNHYAPAEASFRKSHPISSAIRTAAQFHYLPERTFHRSGRSISSTCRRVRSLNELSHVVVGYMWRILTQYES